MIPENANKSRQINRRGARCLGGFRRCGVLLCGHRFFVPESGGAYANSFGRESLRIAYPISSAAAALVGENPFPSFHWSRFSHAAESAALIAAFHTARANCSSLSRTSVGHPFSWSFHHESKEAEQGAAEQSPSRCVSLLGLSDTLDGLCLIGDIQSSGDACALAFD